LDEARHAGSHQGERTNLCHQTYAANLKNLAAEKETLVAEKEKKPRGGKRKKTSRRKNIK
jgi:hypothetical protein